MKEPHNLMKAVFNLNFLMYIIYRNNDFSPNLYISKFAQQYCCNANAHTLNLGYLWWNKYQITKRCCNGKTSISQETGKH